MFYVLEGTVTFECTLDRESAVLGPDEVIRFAPGEFQCGRNRSDEWVRAITLGVPVPASSASVTEWLTRCENCEAETLHGIHSYDGGSIVSYCTVCGTEFSFDERRD